MLSRIKILTIIWMTLSTSYCGAQQFQLMDISQDDPGKVSISFKINPKYAKERYSVQVFSSHDNYQSPLQYVTGDIEGEIEGSNSTYQVIWDAAKELVTYNGQVQLELRGEVIYLPIHGEVAGVKAKHNKTTTLNWTGGETSDRVKIDLLRNGVLVKELANTTNSGTYNWTVDPGNGKGQNYSVRFTNMNNDGESYQTDNFKIAGKTSPLVWVLPLAAGGAAAAVLVLGGGGGDGGVTDRGDNLPDPPLPGN